MTPKPPGDTIAAIATPPGIGGIGIVRLSGPQALAIATRLFRRRAGKGPLLSHRLYLGEIARPGDPTALDEVLLVYMRQPRTYTREDVVEIQCHGGPLLLREVLKAVLKAGARLAEPGEFTKRAFLNGRIDLTQAEAVMDLISSQTKRSLDLANHLRSGKLAQEVARVKDRLVDLLVRMEAAIDFPDEEIPELSPEKIIQVLREEAALLERLVQTFREGRIYREGIGAVIVGKPNVGKSSLLNALLRDERAIVTPIPGTTRDIIEENLSIHGIPLRLRDTAGLRSPAEAIEAEGVRRTRESLAQADLAIWVVDGSEPIGEEDLAILPELGGKKTAVAVNKSDLPPRLSLEELAKKIPGAPLIPISALHGSGMEPLQEAIRDLVLDGSREAPEEILLTSLRHKKALEAAREALCRPLSGDGPLFAEFIAFDLKRALEALGEIAGETTSEEVLDRIFSRFWIGK